MRKILSWFCVKYFPTQLDLLKIEKMIKYLFLHIGNIVTRNSFLSKQLSNVYFPLCFSCSIFMWHDLSYLSTNNCLEISLLRFQKSEETEKSVRETKRKLFVSCCIRSCESGSVYLISYWCHKWPGSQSCCDCSHTICFWPKKTCSCLLSIFSRLIYNLQIFL